MQPQYRRELASLNRNARLAAWGKLFDQPETQSGSLSLADRRQLQEILLQEDDQDIQLFGLIQLAGLGTAVERAGSLPAPANSAKGTGNPASVDEWFGQLFEGRCAIFGITEKNFLRRDEDALIDIARRFPHRSYPDLQTKRVLFQSDAWQKLLVENRYQTMMFVGRLWLYGPNALKLLAGKGLHFDFPNNTRPPSLPRDQLDPSYHSIRERNGEQEPVFHVAQETNGLRTDFGLVQVYTSHNGRYWTTIVQCAGTSSLGTMGAAKWLTYDLGMPLDALGGNPIPLPPGKKENHCMEALLCVTANTTTYAWQPESIELMALHVDDYIWSASDLQWRRSVAPRIELHMHGSSPGAIFVNGRLSTLRPGSHNYRLAVAVILGVARSHQHFIRLCDLSEDEDIWDDKQMETKVVRQRLNTLNQKQLEGNLIIGDEIRIGAQVEVIDDDAREESQLPFTQ